MSPCHLSLVDNVLTDTMVVAYSENNHRSPLFSRFGGLLRGLKVVRAFGQEQRYLKMLMTELDLFQAWVLHCC